MRIDLEATIASGQAFSFVRSGEGYLGIAQGKPVWVGAFEGELIIRAPDGDEPYWRRYFDVDREYEQLIGEHMRDPLIAACVRAYRGLRLLRQPIWETICAFILSANNHQRRIEGLYRGLSARFGDEVRWQGETLYAFPSPERLAGADEAALRAIGVGYRAPYLIKSAAMVADGFSLALDDMRYEQALAHLTQLAGVGEKVADCVLLFSTGHASAFPVDVWMERVLRGHFGMQGTRPALKRQARERFGACAGIIQQYLFHGARMGLCKEEAAT